MSADGPYFPEFDLTPEQRREAAAKILLDAMREMYAKRNREKTRRCRAGKRAAKAATIEPGAPAGESADEGQKVALEATGARSPDSPAP
jgi:hypothetical protein